MITIWNKGWSVKAVCLGSLIAIGGSMIVGILVMAVAGVSQAAGGASPDEIGARMMSFDMLALQASIGTGFSLLGGYVAARISKAREVQHAVASGIPCVLLGLALGRGSLPVWFWVLCYALLFPAAALGGVWARSRNRVHASGAV